MASETAQEPTRRHYRLTYRVRPPDGCPVRETDGTISEVTVLVDENERRCELLVKAENGAFSVDQHDQPTSNSCPCSVIIDHGSVPHFEPGGEPGYMNVAIYVGLTTDAQSISEALESVAPDTELVDYTELGSKADVPIPVNLGALTDKRWAALKCAIVTGYYDTPSQTTIEAMAEKIGISSSAFATRLRKAEREVFEQIRRSI